MKKKSFLMKAYLEWLENLTYESKKKLNNTETTKLTMPFFNDEQGFDFINIYIKRDIYQDICEVYSDEIKKKEMCKINRLGYTIQKVLIESILKK